jgi:hypothetical protein
MNCYRHTIPNGIVQIDFALLLAKQNTQSLSQNSLSQYETQIDELVYALYGITDEERAVVEGVSP